MPDSSAGTKEFYFVGSSQVAEEFDRVFHAQFENVPRGTIKVFEMRRSFGLHLVGEQNVPRGTFSGKTALPSANQQSSIL
ncbi:MAG: hypothetical protein DMG96_22900 [Acidobacteria bacterium]|nr:MAG: hypothetical protein DMG98_21475 [Acidobacteriota bacterium]PYV73566.1 MAG: hypothetical protein DMG96_22900 [Acidobacteriota bacterium]